MKLLTVILNYKTPDMSLKAADALVAATEMLPDARLVTFENSGHAPFVEETARYREELVGFLGGLG